MSKLSEKQIKDSKKLFKKAYDLYVEGNFKESLKKYQEVLGIIEQTEDIAGKVTVYTAIAQVYSKLGETELAKSEEFNCKAIELLQKIEPKDFKTLRQIMSPIRDQLMMGGNEPDPIDGTEEDTP